MPKYEVHLADRKRAIVVQADSVTFEGGFAVFRVWDPIDKRDVITAACSPVLVGELRE